MWPALIIGTAWLIRRVRRRTTADATSSQRPYLVVLALVAAVSFALSLAVTHVMPAAGVLFAAHPGLAVGRSAAWWPSRPASGADCRHEPAAIAGWAGLALILLACTELSAAHALSGYRRAVAHGGRGAGDRRRLCHPDSRMRPSPGVVADACDRPDLLLVVPVALAGAVAGTGVAGPPAGVGRQAGSGSRFPAGWRCSRCVSSRTRCDSPLRCAGLPGRSLALGGAATAVAVCVGLALLVAVPTPVGRGAPAAALTVTAASLPPPAPTSPPTTRRCSMRSLRCRPRSRHRPSSKPSRRTSNPPLADAAAEQNAYMRQRLPARRLSKADSRSARRAIPPRRRRWPWSATRMPRCGIRRSSRSPPSGTGGWRPWPRRPARSMDLPVASPFRRLVELLRTLRAVARPDHGPAASRAPAAGRGERVARDTAHARIG